MRSLRLVVLIVGAAVLSGCDAPNVTTAPTLTLSAVRPGVQIDPTWQNSDGAWTFTGHVDPQGDATEVVLEVGPGPSTARQFEKQIAVAHALVDPGALTITTRDIPDIAEICVRFTATNSGGTSSTPPMCFPHDMPSFDVDADPPTTDFSAPAFGTTTVLASASYTVSWTEADTGSGVGRRSLQRRVATYAAGACGTYQDDGPASTAASPIAVTGLLDGDCYQWIQSLSDQAGNTSATTSGTVRVDLGSPG